MRRHDIASGEKHARSEGCEAAICRPLDIQVGLSLDRPFQLFFGRAALVRGIRQRRLQRLVLKEGRLRCGQGVEKATLQRSDLEPCLLFLRQKGPESGLQFRSFMAQGNAEQLSLQPGTGNAEVQLEHEGTELGKEPCSRRTPRRQEEEESGRLVHHAVSHQSGGPRALAPRVSPKKLGQGRIERRAAAAVEVTHDDSLAKPDGKFERGGEVGLAGTNELDARGFDTRASSCGCIAAGGGRPVSTSDGAEVPFEPLGGAA